VPPSFQKMPDGDVQHEKAPDDSRRIDSDKSKVA
jgi:hypothetical protein